MKIKGAYYGENIIIDNPEDNHAFCVKSIKVNGVKTNTEIASNTFEIDLASLNIDYAASIEIIITHSETCKPKILNPEALKEKCGFNLIGYKQDKKSEEITFTPTNQISKMPYIVEQYRWKRWVEVAKIDVVFSDTATYRFKPSLHSNANIFRIKQNSKRDDACFSNDLKARSLLKEVTFLYDKKANNLTFSTETMYEIYDKKGNFIKSGLSKVVDLGMFIF